MLWFSLWSQLVVVFFCYILDIIELALSVLGRLGRETCG